MLILIKSFKRPYLLEFTIQSILKNISGHYSIIILDDGTALDYLKKIKAKYPVVQIKKSRYYKIKSQSDVAVYDEKGSIILPHQDWCEVVEKYADDYFLILEDDQFITDHIDLNRIEEFCKRNQCMFLSLNIGNKRFTIGTNFNQMGIHLYNSHSLLFLAIKFLYSTSSLLLIRTIRKIFSFFVKESAILNFKKDKLPLYSLYNVSGCIFNKKYYLACNSGANDRVDEDSQLRNAVRYNLMRGMKLNYGISRKQLVKTSFSSSVISDGRGFKFDLMLFNDCLNRRWFDDNLSYFNNINWEINTAIVEDILVKEDNEKLSKHVWNEFVNDFKNTYRNLGFDI
jgi:hypothetical protein